MISDNEIRTGIRKQIITKRKQMSKTEVITKSSLICNKIINSQRYNVSKTIYCYCSINNEVDLWQVIEHAWAHGKTVAVPKVNNKDMTFYQITSIKDLEAGYYNIPEPQNVPPAPPGDIIIVPGVAFTPDGDRLGYGGGFYDRFLSKNKIYSIGVCYDFQQIKTIPTMEHDQKINEIISN